MTYKTLNSKENNKFSNQENILSNFFSNDFNPRYCDVLFVYALQTDSVPVNLSSSQVSRTAPNLRKQNTIDPHTITNISLDVLPTQPIVAPNIDQSSPSTASTSARHSSLVLEGNHDAEVSHLVPDPRALRDL